MLYVKNEVNCINLLLKNIIFFSSALNEDGPYEASVSVARSLRTKFQILISNLTSRSNSKLSCGEMLILAFNSLFENIANAHEDLR
jgi:hypothetical protein